MHLFVQLCRENNKSKNPKVVSVFKSSIKTFDNIFGNIFSCINTVLLKILHSNRKCAKWVEISGCTMDWTCFVGYGLVANVQKDACFGLSLTLCTIFKIYSQFLKIAIFEKIVKIPFLKKCQLFYVFQCGAPSCSHAYNELVWNLVNDKKKSRKIHFYVFLPQKLNITKLLL